ncbi:MAG: hypothetical protein JW751_21070, partial [Polyangiaceae bacterium]|nr:hypothetical protein [Polyangiaceae bacterium]
GCGSGDHRGFGRDLRDGLGGTGLRGDVPLGGVGWIQGDLLRRVAAAVLPPSAQVSGQRTADNRRVASELAGRDPRCPGPTARSGVGGGVGRASKAEPLLQRGPADHHRRNPLAAAETSLPPPKPQPWPLPVLRPAIVESPRVGDTPVRAIRCRRGWNGDSLPFGGSYTGFLSMGAVVVEGWPMTATLAAARYRKLAAAIASCASSAAIVADSR